MLTSIQLVLLLLVIFFLSRVYFRSKEKLLSTKATLFWTIMWIVALVGILMPTTTSRIASFFGVGRGVDVILYVAISLVFYLVFRVYVMIEDLRREITSLIRAQALGNAKTPHKRNPKKPQATK